MSGRQDSNLRPPGPKPGDLPTDLLPEKRKSFGSFRVTGNNNASGFATINPFSRFKLLNYYYSFTTFSLAVHTRIELVAQHRQCRMLAITPMDQIKHNTTLIALTQFYNRAHYLVRPLFGERLLTILPTHIMFCGAEGIRTLILFLAKEALSQLSYNPK